jgi:hypothetical protein
MGQAPLTINSTVYKKQFHQCLICWHEKYFELFIICLNVVCHKKLFLKSHVACFMGPGLSSLFHGSSTWLWRSVLDTCKTVLLYLGWEIESTGSLYSTGGYLCLPHLPDQPLFSLPLKVICYIMREACVYILDFL